MGRDPRRFDWTYEEEKRLRELEEIEAGEIAPEEVEWLRDRLRVLADNEVAEATHLDLHELYFDELEKEIDRGALKFEAVHALRALRLAAIEEGCSESEWDRILRIVGRGLNIASAVLPFYRRARTLIEGIGDVIEAIKDRGEDANGEG